MALTLRADKGDALTHDELDANFTYLQGLIAAKVGLSSVTYSSFLGSVLSENLELGRFYKIKDKSNIIVQAIGVNYYVQISKNKAKLTLTAETEYTYNYTYEVLEDVVVPKFFAYDADGEPVTVKITNIKKTNLKLTSAVDCTVIIEV